MIERVLISMIIKQAILVKGEQQLASRAQQIGKNNTKTIHAFLNMYFNQSSCSNFAKDGISTTQSASVIQVDQLMNFGSNPKKPNKQKKKIGKQSTSLKNENEEKEIKEIERIRQLVQHHKKNECGISKLMYNTINDEPVFILWGSCVLDLRLSKDLSYQKDAGWSYVMKMERAEIFNNRLSFSMNQFVPPIKQMEHISELLLKYNLNNFKQLADAIVTYQQITNFMINQLLMIKQQFLGKESQLEELLLERQHKFDELKKQIMKEKEDEGYVFIAIESGFDYFNEQTVFKHATLSQSFLDLMGMSAEQYVNCSMRKGGLEFFEPVDQVNYVKSILDLVLTQSQKSSFDAKIKTYDNIDLYVTIDSEIYTIDGNQFTQFTGDNILTIQSYKLNQNQLKTLHEIRKKQIINPLIEWQEDFAYSVMSESLVEKFYQEQSKILKKMKKLNKIYKTREERKNINQFNSQKVEEIYSSELAQSE